VITLKQFAKTVVHENAGTYDLPWIQAKYQYIPVFVYGTEQQNYSEDEAMEDHPCIGYGFTMSSDYVLYETDDHQPVALVRPDVTYSARLRGELYLVSPEVLTHLDKRFTNGVFFIRRERYVQWYKPEDKDKTDKEWFVSHAFIYHANQASWQGRLDRNQLKRMSTLTAMEGKEYFQFRMSDDQPNRIRVDKRAL
jgi:gamma-glutamylcyclotransferase (GGCT)/AIG2-like uncharacterized protein YtfP